MYNCTGFYDCSVANNEIKTTQFTWYILRLYCIIFQRSKREWPKNSCNSDLFPMVQFSLSHIIKSSISNRFDWALQSNYKYLWLRSILLVRFRSSFFHYHFYHLVSLAFLVLFIIDRVMLLLYMYCFQFCLFISPHQTIIFVCNWHL